MCAFLLNIWSAWQFAIVNGPVEYFTPAELSVMVEINAGEYAQYLYEAASIQANCSAYVQADGSTDYLGGAYVCL